MKEEWTDKLRRKLDGHEMTPPAGLWEGISNEMGLEPAPVSKATIIRKWHWAAAAVVLALVGFFVFYGFNDVEPKQEAKNEMPIKASTPEKPKTTDGATIPEEPTKPSLLAIATPVEPQQVAIVETQQITTEETNENEQASVENEQASVENEQASVENETKIKTGTLHQKQTCLPNVVEPATTASYSEKSSRWTIGLAGSNGLLFAANDYVNTMAKKPLYNDASHAEHYTNNSFGLEQPYTDLESKHHIPLRFGLSLQYQLSNRLALLSGISYTYLKSEFNYSQHQYLNYNQKLSYLGIPVGLSWRVWSTDKFNIYLAGGTLIEKCLSAEVSEGNISTKPWQLSVNAAAGAEYNFTRQFGVSLEPSLGYYFNDGTKLAHYYKEHPLAPSLQFGLRLHLK